MGKWLSKKAALQRFLIVSILSLYCSLMATACSPLGNNAAKPIASKPVTEPLITWPARITLMPEDEKGSSSLNIGNGYLYATTSGYIGDGGHYEGHVVAIQLATGKTTVFNVLCANIKRLLNNSASDPNYCPYIQAGIWARAGTVIDPVTGNVFIATGNGPFDAATGGHNYGDSVIELSPDLTRLIDTYTPDNYQYLQDADADLGSAAPALLPRQNNSKTPYLAVQAGKDNKLRLLDRQNLSGQHGPNNVGGELQTVDLPNACGVPTHPLAWNDHGGVTWLFVANSCGFSAFKVITNASSQTGLQLAYKKDIGGSSPFIANNNIIYSKLGRGSRYESAHR